jgi:hypothetical protein
VLLLHLAVLVELDQAVDLEAVVVALDLLMALAALVDRQTQAVLLEVVGVLVALEVVHHQSAVVPEVVVGYLMVE